MAVLILSPNISFASKDYSNVAGGWTDDGATFEISFGADSEEGIYSRYLGMFLDDGECFSGVCATAEVDLHLINVGHHWSYSENADFIIEGGYIGYDATTRGCGYGTCVTEGIDDSGYNLMAGFRAGSSDGLEFKILIGRGDVDGAFTIGQAEINYNFSENWSSYLGLIHLDGENSTTLGFKYDF
tara:strand:+ start:318 stop:872 length:555 start_codon:yes stop_codon:yes gene_type:complete